VARVQPVLQHGDAGCCGRPGEAALPGAAPQESAAEAVMPAGQLLVLVKLKGAEEALWQPHNGSGCCRQR